MSKFTRRTALQMSAGLLAAPSVLAQSGAPEKTSLKFGFIKLTDMAPLAIAKEKGFFADEGLDVTLEAQPNWTAVFQGVADGRLDGSHMLAGQPLAAWGGIGVQSRFVTPLSMDLNGNGITVSNDLWGLMSADMPRNSRGRVDRPVSASHLKPIVDQLKAAGNPMNLGMVFPVSNHNYEIRYWLAAGGINPGQYDPADLISLESGNIDSDIVLKVVPPPKMVETMRAGLIEGYCVGEPWNQKAVFEGVGVPVIDDHHIVPFNPEKLFGFNEDFYDTHPNTVIAVVKAMLRANKWLDDGGTFNRPEASQILSRPEYVGAEANVIANSMTGTFEFEPGEKRILPEFNIFFRKFATYPFYSDAIWTLTQMRRWGQLTEAHPDDWYDDFARGVYRPDTYMTAASMLIDEGHLTEDEVPFGTDGYRAPTENTIDGVVFDGKQPTAYLSSFDIGNQS